MHLDHSVNIIEVADVSFGYGENVVLKDVNLNIHKGDYVGVIGPNGGGKSTLIKLILGLLRPDKGEIKLFNKSIKDFKEWPKIGYVAQKATNFDPRFPATVMDVVSMGRYSSKGIIKGLTRSDEEKVMSALKQVELTEFKNRLVGDLSGGQQQKVFIARALAQNAEIIFLDEPTSGVDSESQEQFYSLLKKLNHELGITMVLISHDIDVVTEEVTEVACINQKLVYHGSTSEFIKKDTGTLKFISHRH